MLTIESTFKPRCNEVWVKSVHDPGEKFWLVQKLQENVSYYVKHSGDFFYKVSNEEDKQNYKVTKFLVPSHVKKLELLEGSSVQPSEPESEMPAVKGQVSSDLIPSRSYQLSDRSTELVPLTKQDEATGLQRTVYASEHGEAIKAIEVFKHYMALVVEKSK